MCDQSRKRKRTKVRVFPAKKAKIEKSVVTLSTQSDDELQVTIWKPQKSRRGKLKVPSDFPRFNSKSIMFVILSPLENMSALYETMRGEQQEFWKDVPGFLGSIVQGEYSPKGMAHLQGVVNFKAATETTTLFKLFAPYLTETFGLQVTKCNSRKDAWHYCSKPHNKCECFQCQKARKCQPNWTLPVVCGAEPVGQGKKFAEFEKAIALNPTKKVMIEDFGALYCRYHNGMNQIRKYYQFKKAVAEYKVNGLDFLDCYKLAISIGLAYNSDPTLNRNITWIWSGRLNTGKTIMANFVKSLIGFEKCMDGIKSWKHMVTAYEGEVFCHFNFEKTGPPSNDDLKVLECADDGGFRQAAMYKGDKKIIAMKVLVTSNHPPPDWWLADGEKRVSESICIDPPGAPKPRVWYNELKEDIPALEEKQFPSCLGNEYCQCEKCQSIEGRRGRWNVSA